MDALAGPFAVAALLVAVGGVAKVASPSSTAAALAGVGVPFPGGVARGLGLAELAIGAVALAYGGPGPAALVALAYVGFAGFVELALRRGQTSCGCFGRDDTPPTRLHTVVDLVGAAVALAYATGDAAPLDAMVADQPWAGVPFVGFVLIGTTLVTAVLALLPSVLRPPSDPVAPFGLDRASAAP